jgi:hypothetical protein
MPGAGAEMQRLFLNAITPHIDPEELEKLAPDFAVVLVQLYNGQGGLLRPLRRVRG